MKRTLCFVVLLAAAFLLTACGEGEPANRLEAIQQEGTIKVVTSADFPPFEFVDEDGEFAGFDIDFAYEIGSRLGVEVEIADMPFDSLVASIQEGTLDIAIAAMAATEERDEVIDFTDDYYWYGECLLVAENFDLSELKTVEDMANFLVGAATGTTTAHIVEEFLIDTGLLPEENFFLYERAEQGVLDLQVGRIDIYATGCVAALAFAHEYDGLMVTFSEGELERGTTHVAVREGEPELLEALNGVIADLHSEGFFDELESKWIIGE